MCFSISKMFLDIFVFMKSLIKFVFFFAIINFSTSFAQKFNCQYECQGIKDGSIELVVWSTKKSNKYTIQQAQKDALMAVIKTSISSKNCQAFLIYDDKTINPNGNLPHQWKFFFDVQEKQNHYLVLK